MNVVWIMIHLPVLDQEHVLVTMTGIVYILSSFKKVNI